MASDSPLLSNAPALFADLPVQPAYDVGAVRVRLHEMLTKMQAAASWPWKSSTVETYRSTLWPSLLGKLPDKEEAARWRVAIEAEARRLDKA